tara:strand:+ start:8447 stop:8959 length:513 start_codon:yes stop_codon:yes gene_type:complete
MKIEKISGEESELIGDLYDAMTQDNWNKAKVLVRIIRDRIGQQPDRNTERRTDFSGNIADIKYDKNHPLVRALTAYDNWADQAGITGHIYKNENEVIKMKRQEVAKIRRELQKTERALSLQEKPKQEPNRNLGPVELPDKEKYLNERSASSDVPNVIHLPKKQKKPENKW